MNPDEFDQLIRHSDPAVPPLQSGSIDPLLQESQCQWSVLSRRRVVIRTRVTLSLAAIGLFAILGGSALWFRTNPKQADGLLAVATPAESTADRTSTDLADAATEAPDESPSESPGESLRNETDIANSGVPRPQPVTEPPKRVPGNSQQLNEFAAFIDHAGEYDSNSWREARDLLAHQDTLSQRTVVGLVPKLVDPQRREKAFDLVCAAAADSKRPVLLYWLSQPSLRSMAFNRLATDASLGQSIELIQRASNESERRLLCRNIAASAESRGVGVLLELARDTLWRSAVGSSSRELNPSHIQSLIMLMRERNVPVRTAAAFVLASVPGDQLDQVLASMILRGRFRQPAYLVLLSRDTPRSRAFLAQAASRRDLTPALVSARMHFANIQPTLQQWIAESKGTRHEPSDTSQQHFPDLGGGHRCVHLPDPRRDIG